MYMYMKTVHNTPSLQNYYRNYTTCTCTYMWCYCKNIGLTQPPIIMSDLNLMELLVLRVYIHILWSKTRYIFISSYSAKLNIYVNSTKFMKRYR